MAQIVIGIGQTRFSNAAIRENTIKISQIIEEATTLGASIVIFPELCLTGYDIKFIKENLQDCLLILEKSDDNAFIELTNYLEGICQVSRQKQCAVVVGAPVKFQGSDEIFNSAVIIDRTGNIVGVYSKIFLWEDERSVFSAGNEMSILTIDSFRIGIGICYDAGFPEFVRAYKKIGIDLVVFLSAFSNGAMKSRYDIYHPARALENGVGLAVANFVGHSDIHDFYGESRFYSPSGDLILNAGLKEGAYICTYVMQEIRDVGESLPYIADLESANLLKVVEVHA
jgi:predicted amidohydrolase